MKFNASYKIRFTIATAFFVALISGVTTYLALEKIEDAALEAFSAPGIAITQNAVDKIDPARFAELAKSLDENEPYYTELYNELYKLKLQSHCKYLYTMVQKEGNVFTYVVDGSTVPEDEENFSPIGTDEDLSSYGVYPRLVLKNKVMTVSEIEQQDNWGWTITMYAPIVLGDTAVGFVACDFEAAEIVGIINASGRIMILASVVVIAVCLVLMYLYIASFFKKLFAVAHRMNEIAGGESDLTVRIPETGENEITAISKACNGIMESLRGMIASEKSAVSKLSENSRVLLNQNRENVALIETAGTSMSAIASKARNQRELTQKATGTIDTVVNNVINLDEKAREQIGAIQHSSEAVSQIARNIDDVNKKIAGIADEYEKIVVNTQDGKEKQKEVTAKIEAIEELTKKLFEANRIIAEISSQTNLLAMNASIEAAHAGKAGQGFSVVADEIRSLAENSATQSKSIKTLVSDVELAVKAMIGASSVSSEAFDTLEEKIKSMDSSLQTVHQKINEQTSEADKINEMMDVLKNSCEAISVSSGQLKSKNTALAEQIADLQEKAGEILSATSEAEGNLDGMKGFAQRAADNSEENLSLADSVKNLVDSYKTE